MNGAVVARRSGRVAINVRSPGARLTRSATHNGTDANEPRNRRLNAHCGRAISAAIEMSVNAARAMREPNLIALSLGGGRVRRTGRVKSSQHSGGRTIDDGHGENLC